MRISGVVKALAMAVLICLGMGAQAGTYPDRPIKLLVAFSAGGTSDTIARMLAERLGKVLGQPVIVENHTGANGIVGTEIGLRSAPDGYTIMLLPSGHAINSTLNPAATYDPVKDFTMISLIGTVPMVVTASPTLGVKNIAELIAKAKHATKKIDFGSGGVGASNHLAVELFATMTGIKTFNHIPYRGDAPGITDLLGGHVSFIFLNVPAALPLVRSGKLTALAITSEKRLPLLPNVPTVEETVPGYVAGSWHIIIGPKGIPADRVKVLSQAIMKIMHTPEFEKRMQDLGITPVGSTPAELKAFLKSEVKKWAKVIHDADVKL